MKYALRLLENWVSSLFLCYNRITIVKKMENQMTKTPFITADKLEQITAEFPTPFHLYDEKGIRETARAVNAAFSWNPGFKEFFAVKLHLIQQSSKS